MPPSLSAQRAALCPSSRRHCSAVAVIRPFLSAVSMIFLLALIEIPKGFSIMTLTPDSRQGIAELWW